MSKSKRIVLGVTGSIAAYKAGDIIRRLKERQFAVSVIMTREAGNFITPLTLAGLSGEKVYQDMFEATDETWARTHIGLAGEAAVFLIAPATANVIAKLAHGLADDLLTCTALATRAPIVVAPAMNDAMFHNKIVQENCGKLKKAGFHFVEPVKGELACGVVGDGHLADVDDIVKAVVRWSK